MPVDNALARLMRALAEPGGKDAGVKLRDAGMKAINPDIPVEDIAAPFEEQSGFTRFLKRMSGVPANRDLNNQFLQSLSEFRQPFEQQRLSSKLSAENAQNLAFLKAAIDEQADMAKFGRDKQMKEYEQGLGIATQQGVTADQLSQIKDMLPSVAMSNISTAESDNLTKQIANQVAQEQSAATSALLPYLTQNQRDKLELNSARIAALKQLFSRPASESGEFPIGAYYSAEGTLSPSLVNPVDALMDQLRARGMELSNLQAEKKLEDLGKSDYEKAAEETQNARNALDTMSRETTGEGIELELDEAAAVLDFIKRLRANKAAGGNG